MKLAELRDRYEEGHEVQAEIFSEPRFVVICRLGFSHTIFQYTRMVEGEDNWTCDVKGSGITQQGQELFKRICKLFPPEAK